MNLSLHDLLHTEGTQPTPAKHVKKKKYLRAVDAGGSMTSSDLVRSYGVPCGSLTLEVCPAINILAQCWVVLQLP